MLIHRTTAWLGRERKSEPNYLCSGIRDYLKIAKITRCQLATLELGATCSSRAHSHPKKKTSSTQHKRGVLATGYSTIIQSEAYMSLSQNKGQVNFNLRNESCLKTFIINHMNLYIYTVYQISSLPSLKQKKSNRTPNPTNQLSSTNRSQRNWLCNRVDSRSCNDFSSTSDGME